jgi:hypothetical protein
VTEVPAGNPATAISKSADADVIVLFPSLVTVSSMTTEPLAPASALVIGGVSLADERGTVKVDVVLVPCDGADGDEELPQPTASILRPTTSVRSRFMLFCLP